MIDPPPKKICLASTAILLVLVTIVQPAAAQGLDRIRDRHGIKTGKITKMSALGVTLTKSGIKTKKPVEEILSITFAGQPPELTPARRATKAGRFEVALEKLKKLIETMSSVTRSNKKSTS